MGRNTTLIVHAGGVRRTREELATLHTPSPTATWKAVPHADLVGELIQGLTSQGVAIARDEYATTGRAHSKILRGVRATVLRVGDSMRATGLSTLQG